MKKSPVVLLLFFIFCGRVLAADGDAPTEKKKAKVKKPVAGESAAPAAESDSGPSIGTSGEPSVGTTGESSGVVKPPRKKKKSKAKKSASDEATTNSTEGEVVSDSEQVSDSRTIRAKQRQNYSLLYTPLSDFLLKFGAQLQWAPSPSLQVGLLGLTGSETKDSSYEGGTVTSSGTGLVLALHARYFVGNSFNIFSGLGYRSAAIKLNLKDKLLGSIDGDLKVQSIAIPFFIGNHWTWSSGFTLGCDWIGAWIPVSGKTEASIKGNLSQKDRDEFVDIGAKIGDGLAKTTSFTLFLTSIGWAF
jgi:hypothetical protein